MVLICMSAKWHLFLMETEILSFALVIAINPDAYVTNGRLLFYFHSSLFLSLIISLLELVLNSCMCDKCHFLAMAGCFSWFLSHHCFLIHVMDLHKSYAWLPSSD